LREPKRETKDAQEKNKKRIRKERVIYSCTHGLEVEGETQEKLRTRAIDSLKNEVTFMAKKRRENEKRKKDRKDKEDKKDFISC